MKLSAFKSGSFREEFRYKSFQPSRINHVWTWEEPELHLLLAEANRRLGELNAFSLIVPDVDRFITMHVVLEAQTSSKIEGTQTSIEEAAETREKEIAVERRDDWLEVRNYVTAMNEATQRLVDLPLSSRLLCEVHRTLLCSGRGKTKLPGEFRRSQNWIGGASLSDAAFIPPNHEEVPSLMGDLENFLHNQEIAVPELIRAAIAHYQFETIHPFLDGNGRVGRLMIPLYLVSRGLLAKPTLYLSAHLERHRASYYDSLMRTRTASDLLGWVRFFLVGVIETARHGVDVFRRILQLRTDLEARMNLLGRRAPQARLLLEHLYRFPTVTVADAMETLHVSQPTAGRLLQTLQKEGLLKPITARRRDRVFAFEPYLSLFRS